MTRRSGIALFCILAACGGGATQTNVIGDGGTPSDDAGTADASTTDAISDSAISKDVDTKDAFSIDATPLPTLDASLGPLTRVRIMAANITSGTLQAYEAPGIRIFQGLKPDIVMIQEFNYKGGTLRNLVDTAFGTEFFYYVETRVGGIPNGIVTRYPIIESGTWVDSNVSDRAYVYAHIDVPGPIDLWAVSLHLLTTGATQRDLEAQEVTAYIQGKVPPTDYLVIGGDFNTALVDEAAITDFSSVVVTTAPYPADQLGNTNTSTNRDEPHDWVLASPGLDSLAVPVIVGDSSYATGLVFDTRVYSPLTDVPPIMSTDSAVAGMQHMPVVRDFGIGGPSSDAGADAGDD